jgi:hypothetical protein
MRVLQTYDHATMLSDVIARGWRIADAMRAGNVVRAKAGDSELSYDAYARFLRGESHSNGTAKALAEALGKTEADYRQMPPATAKRKVKK